MIQRVYISSNMDSSFVVQACNQLNGSSVAANIHMPSTPMYSKLRAAVTNLLQEFDGGMESRTTLIQEGEDDEDIIMLDTPEIWYYSPSVPKHQLRPLT
jgi:hypothetical protein